MYKFILNTVWKNKDLQTTHANAFVAGGKGEMGYPFRILRLKAKPIITLKHTQTMNDTSLARE